MLFFNFCQIFGIFDEFSKFHSVFRALHFEKSSNMGTILAKHEGTPCSTFALNLFLHAWLFQNPKSEFRVPDPSLFGRDVDNVLSIKTENILVLVKISEDFFNLFILVKFVRKSPKRFFFFQLCPAIFRYLLLVQVHEKKSFKTFKKEQKKYFNGYYVENILSF